MPMTKRTAIKNYLFASQYRRDKIDELVDSLDQLASHGHIEKHQRDGGLGEGR